MAISKDSTTILTPGYRGRFAPSPTGPLHLGSLVAAVGSYLEARHRGGQWRVRMEDIDPPREVAGAADSILRVLDAHGFEWDGEVWYQSRRSAFYLAAIEQLKSGGYIYGCACSRKEIADSAIRGIDGPVYPGTCRQGMPAGRTVRALRFRVGEGATEFVDAIQGKQHQVLASEVGDFVVQRADGFFAYQLAVVVDDAAQGITHIVRGADLLDSTARQIELQRRLGFATPEYAHLPVLVNEQGEKLSKQTRAAPILIERAGEQLTAALVLLGQSPAAGLARAPVRDIWSWAVENWRLDRVPKARGVSLQQV